MFKPSSYFKMSIIPALMVGLCFSLAGYMTWNEYKINRDLVDASINGNPAAIEILIKYDKPSKLDSRLIYEAIDGNVYAIKALKLDIQNQ